jgi:hypothetical protein
VKPGILCLLLLPACSFFSSPQDHEIREYVLTWTCVSPEGCERTEDVQRIDHMAMDRYFDFYFTSTQDESFSADAQRISTDTLGTWCYWLYFLSLFGHDLERSQLCHTPGGFELQVAIPNEDPATHSKWLVKGRDLALL